MCQWNVDEGLWLGFVQVLFQCVLVDVWIDQYWYCVQFEQCEYQQEEFWRRLYYYYCVYVMVDFVVGQVGGYGIIVGVQLVVIEGDIVGGYVVVGVVVVWVVDGDLIGMFMCQFRQVCGNVVGLVYLFIVVVYGIFCVVVYFVENLYFCF